MMTPTLAVNGVIKPSLTENLGIALATLVILQNGKKCTVVISNLDREGYGRLVDSISSDYRVVKTFGEERLPIKKKEWVDVVEN